MLFSFREMKKCQDQRILLVLVIGGRDYIFRWKARTIPGFFGGFLLPIG